MAVRQVANRIRSLTRWDSWENILTGLGRAERDKRLSSFVKPVPANLTEEVWEALYSGDDVAARAAELPAREMTRQGFEVSIEAEGEGDESSRTEDVTAAADAAKATMGIIEETDVMSAFFEAIVWARVHGGALVQYVVDDGQDTDQPLNEDQIQSFLGLKVWTRWQLRPKTYYSDPDDILRFGKVETYTIYRTDHPQYDKGAFGAVIHESRVARFDGTLTTPYRKRNQEGWSDSIYTRMQSIIRDYSTAHEGVAHVLQDWNQFVYRMKDLNLILDSEGGCDQIIDRVQTIDMTRSVVRGILLDADNESAERLGVNASGLPESLDRMAQRLAQAAEVPLTLLLGQSPAGMNATGASDIRFFYDQMKSKQEKVLRPPLEKCVRLIFKSGDGPTGGVEPENWSLTFRPLWQMSEKETAEIRKANAETDAAYIDRGVLTEREVAQSRFGGDRYSSETHLDVKEREARAEAEEMVKRHLEENPPEEIAGPPPPEPEPEETGSASEAAPVVEPTEALNGAQVTALITLVQSVSAGELSYDGALAIMTTAFPISEARARSILAGSEELDPPRPEPSPIPPPTQGEDTEAEEPGPEGEQEPEQEPEPEA